MNDPTLSSSIQNLVNFPDFKFKYFHNFAADFSKRKYHFKYCYNGEFGSYFPFSIRGIYSKVVVSLKRSLISLLFLGFCETICCPFSLQHHFIEIKSE